MFNYLKIAAVSKIEPLSEPLYGNEWVLSCIANMPPPGHMADMQLDWYGPGGSAITENSTEFIIRGAHIVNGHLQRDLVFPCLTPSLNGVYTCTMQAFFEDANETLSETNTYSLHVLSELTLDSHN